MYSIYSKATLDEKGRDCDPMQFVVRLAAGKYDSPPFKLPMLEEARACIMDRLSLPVGEDIVAPRQVIRLRLIKHLAML